MVIFISPFEYSVERHSSPRTPNEWYIKLVDMSAPVIWWIVTSPQITPACPLPLSSHYVLVG
jgi:hypothetical protein